SESKKVKSPKSPKVEEIRALEKSGPSCWKCKGSHYPRKCPQLQHKCYYCGENGHIARNCSKKLRATCFICNKSGHISTNYPLRSQNDTTKSTQSEGTDGVIILEDENNN